MAKFMIPQKWLPFGSGGVILIALGIILAAQLYTPSETSATASASKILFTTDRDGNDEIYTMDSDGSNKMNLTNHEANDVNGQFSPDGSQIVFSSDRDGNFELYIMNSDGSNLMKLTFTTDPAENGYPHYPRWSPNGSKILFQSNRVDPADARHRELYVINADGTQEIRLTSDSIRDDRPVWSPDGTKIAWSCGGNSRATQVCTMNANGTAQRIISSGGSYNVASDWSPDSSKITYHSYRSAGRTEIFVMNADGTNQTRLTTNTVYDIGPKWSPDGNTIAFRSEITPTNYEIYVTDPIDTNGDGNGDNLTNLTNYPAKDLGQIWSPDSTRIAFNSDRYGDTEIFVINRDGTGVTRLTNNSEGDFVTDWGISLADDEGPITSTVVADPNPVPINTSIGLTAKVDDSNSGSSNIESARYEVRDSSNGVIESNGMSADDSYFDSPTEEVLANIGPFTAPAVLEVCVSGTDTEGNTGEEECILIAVYDPHGGFVTGGGWIDSPPGACKFDECIDATTGKAKFGFVSKYKKGATIPTGETEFQFKAGNLNFHSSSYDWLVIAGPKAMYKGDGTVNGIAGYTFQINAIDGQINGGGGDDKFRIKIKESGGGVIYDNQMGAGDNADPTTVLGGGSITVHEGK